MMQIYQSPKPNSFVCTSVLVIKERNICITYNIYDD